MQPARKKILYVITKSNFGGAQRYVFDLATNLPEDQFSVSVALGGTGGTYDVPGLLAERLDEQHIRVVPIRNFMRNVSPLRDIAALRELVHIIRRERPDIIHLNSSKAVILGAIAARIARVPHIVATVHGWPSHEDRPFVQRMIIRSIEKLGVLLADTTIVVSHHDARHGTTTIHNGISSIDTLSREDARRELGVAQNTFLIGTIGELTRNKDHTTLIRALEVVRREHPTVTLRILGEGDMRQSLTPLLEGAGFHDALVGYKDRAAAYLPAFDLFVLPSLKEGLPYVLLEAGSVGIPVIATSVGGIPEIIEHGTTGLLVSPKNSAVLATLIASTIMDPERRMSMAQDLKRHIDAHFTLERMIGETFAVYNRSN